MQQRLGSPTGRTRTPLARGLIRQSLKPWGRTADGVPPSQVKRGVVELQRAVVKEVLSGEGIQRRRRHRLGQENNRPVIGAEQRGKDDLWGEARRTGDS
jgi:hypothetical protein